LERTVILESNDAFQRQLHLGPSIRYKPTGLGSRLTLYGELVRFGRRIIIEELLNVDLFVGRFFLRPREVMALLDPYAHPGCRRNISTYMHTGLNGWMW